jgi:hypothetical protein
MLSTLLFCGLMKGKMYVGGVPGGSAQRTVPPGCFVPPVGIPLALAAPVVPTNKRAAVVSVIPATPRIRPTRLDALVSGREWIRSPIGRPLNIPFSPIALPCLQVVPVTTGVLAPPRWPKMP